MIWIDINKDEFVFEKKYAFDLIFSTLGIDYKFLENKNEMRDSDLVIYYSPVFEKRFLNKFIWIKESENLFNSNYLKSEPKYNVKKLDLKTNIKSIKNIISIFSNDNRLFENIDGGIYLYTDIISDIFFMVTRYEEVILKDKDLHERFLLEKSLSYKYKFLDRPIVNEQIELVLSLLQSMDERIEKKKRFGNKEFVFFLSHDIDSIFKYKDKLIKSIGVKLLREKNISYSIKAIKNYYRVIKDKNNDPFWKFNYLLDIEEQNNISASYYFMSGGETGKDNYYNINNNALKDIFKRIKYNSSEIGIHGSYNSYDNLDILSKEKNKLSKVSNIIGIRQHYLRFKVPNTWVIQEQCNLEYDTTVGYAKYAGFRAGICTPYKPFDVLNKRTINILEIPLIVMDGTISEEQYMGLTPKEAKEYVKELINKIIDVNGVFSLLWHNSSLDENSFWKDWIKVYEDIIEYCIIKNALSISGDKIVKLYN